MILLAAVMMATQTAAAGVPSSTPATTQQKQELSRYPFKAATAALKSPAQYPISKPDSLAPIPPLEVPPTMGSASNGQSTSSPTGSDKRQEVPRNWQPPHAELTTAAINAVAVQRQWETGAGTPTPGPDGRVIYIYGQGMPVLICAPLRVCAIELQAGETLQSPPQIGDSRRWDVTPVMSGSGLEQRPLLIVKPIEPGLETDLILPTDRRTYVLKLVSDPTRFTSRIAFQYPADEQAKWISFQAQQDAAKRDLEAAAAQQKAKDKDAGALPISEGSLDNLYFDYQAGGDAAYRPQGIFDDGQHTYLVYPKDGRFREMPTLLILVNGRTELVNFRVNGNRYIVDRLFDKAVLVVGVGKKQTQVTITRGTPYSGAGKRS